MSFSFVSTSHIHDGHIINIIVSGEEFQKIEKARHVRSNQELVPYQKEITMMPSLGLGVFDTETMKKDHNLPEDTVFICRVCYRGFSSKCAVDFHQLIKKEECELQNNEICKANQCFISPSFFSLSSQKLDDKITSVVVSKRVFKIMENKGYQRYTQALLVYQKAMYQQTVNAKRPSGLGVCHGETMEKHHKQERKVQKKQREMEPKVFNEGFLMKPSYKGKSHLGFGQQPGVLSLNGGISNNVYPTCPPPWTSGPFFTEGTTSSHALSNEINLELTLGPSKSSGGGNSSSNVVYSTSNAEVTRELPKDGLYHSSVGNPSSSHTKSPLLPQSTYFSDHWFPIEDKNGGASSSGSRRIIGKAKKMIMGPEDDGTNIGNGGLQKKKRSPRRKLGK